jgi:hypothetical protein
MEGFLTAGGWTSRVGMMAYVDTVYMIMIRHLAFRGMVHALADGDKLWALGFLFYFLSAELLVILTANSCNSTAVFTVAYHYTILFPHHFGICLDIYRLSS